MFTLGAEVVRTWADCAMVAIDRCDRSHAQFRQQASLPNQRKSAEAAANRVLCSQAHAAHVALGGEAAPGGSKGVQGFLDIVGVGAGATDEPNQKKSHPGSPYLRFLNCNMRAYKVLRSPDRPLSQEELDHVREQARQEWAKTVVMSDGEAEQWRLANRTAKARQALVDQSGAQPNARAFVGLWGGSPHRGLLLDVPTLRRFGVGLPCAFSEAWRDETVYVRSEVERRCVDGAPSLPPVGGCFAQKKNVCKVRGVHPGYILGRIEAVARFLSRWADSIGNGRAQPAGELIRLSPCTSGSAD